MKLIKEMCKREGKKVQVSRGNVMEMMSKLADILIDPTPECQEMRNEFCTYIGKKALKKFERSRVRVDLVIDLLEPKKQEVKMAKKKASKKMPKKPVSKKK